MTKKNLVLLLFTLGLAVVYAIWFTDWFHPVALRISHTHRDLHPHLQHGNALPSLKFGVNGEFRLTEIKVVPLAGYEANHNILPLWHLVSDSNSVPVKTFFYGEYIRGMRPNLKGAGPEALQTNVTYRMFVRAGKAAGQHDFDLQE
jgi:hypothetical protein